MRWQLLITLAACSSPTTPAAASQPTHHVSDYPSCAKVVDKIVGDLPDTDDEWRVHHADNLEAACELRPWSVSHRVCLYDESSEDCDAEAYEKSPLKARCDKLVPAMSARVQASLDNEAKRAYREALDEPRERIACALGRWTERDFECLERAKTNADDQACVGKYRLKRGG